MIPQKLMSFTDIAPSAVERLARAMEKEYGRPVAREREEVLDFAADWINDFPRGEAAVVDGVEVGHHEWSDPDDWEFFVEGSYSLTSMQAAEVLLEELAV